MKWPLILLDKTTLQILTDNKKAISVQCANTILFALHGWSQIVNAHSQEIRSQ